MPGTYYLGIDPGLKGGLAILSDVDGVILEPMPTIENELNVTELSRLIGQFAADIRFAILEDVGAMPKQGVVSMFKFGKVFGIVQGVLTAHRVPYRLVKPQAWMKVMHEGVSAKLESKARSRLAFQRLFPGVNALATERSKVPHEGMIEACLIAEYARRTT